MYTYIYIYAYLHTYIYMEYTHKYFTHAKYLRTQTYILINTYPSSLEYSTESKCQKRGCHEIMWLAIH